MMMRGKVAVVVGSGSGIGREIVLRMGAEGADVVLTGRSTGEMEEVAGLVRTPAAMVGRSGIRVNLVSPCGVEGPRLDRVIAAAARGDRGRGGRHGRLPVLGAGRRAGPTPTHGAFVRRHDTQAP